jgi:two-component sensor histidine kinase/ABC-type amino acid transport substrate-binding protein
VAFDNDYPPYCFLDAEGHIQGILADQWAAWSRATGIEVQLKPLPWAEALRVFEAGEADVLDTVFENPERKAKYDFSPPYATIEVPVFIHKSIQGISSPADLKSFRVAVKAGDAAIAKLAEYGITSVSLYPGYKELVDAAARLETRIFCVDKPPAIYYLYKDGADRDFRIAFTLNQGEFHRAVRKGQTALLALVEKGFASLPRSTLEAIDRKWLGAPIASLVDLRIIGLVGAGILALILVLALLAAALRRRVSIATEELRGKVGELEASEAKTRAFIKALPDLFFVYDREGRYLEIFTSTPELLSDPPERLIGKRVDEVGFSEDMVAGLKAKLAEAIDGGHMTGYDYELEIPTGRRLFEGRIVPLGPHSALLVSRDVTETRAQEKKLRESLRDKEILLREIHHRVKNNMQVISSLIAIQADSFSSDSDRVLLAETQTRIRSMARLHELLYDSPELASIEASEYLKALVNELSASYGRSNIGLSCTDDVRLSLDEAVPFGLIANELVSNALKYAYPADEDGRIEVRLRRQGEEATLIVSDGGKGLPSGMVPAEAKTMGFLLVFALVDQLGGSLTFSGGGGVMASLVFRPAAHGSGPRSPSPSQPES